MGTAARYCPAPHPTAVSPPTSAPTPLSRPPTRHPWSLKWPPPAPAIRGDVGRQTHTIIYNPRDLAPCHTAPHLGSCRTDSVTAPDPNERQQLRFPATGCRRCRRYSPFRRRRSLPIQLAHYLHAPTLSGSPTCPPAALTSTASSWVRLPSVRRHTSHIQRVVCPAPRVAAILPGNLPPCLRNPHQLHRHRYRGPTFRPPVPVYAPSNPI